MAKKDLKFFMRSAEPEVVTAPGPATFVDDEGKVIEFEIKVLSQSAITKINNAYRKRSIATDKKGNPLVMNGEVVWKTERDANRAAAHMIVEALQYPNLKDPDLMAHYNCHDITEMPALVFSRADEFSHVTKIVMAALGLGPGSEAETSDDETLNDAKN